MDKKRSVLDRGYVELIESWGNEERIIEAARMSTAKGFQGWEPNPEIADHKGDKHLLAYLYKHEHMTPFEMVGFTVEVKAPIFVFREWHRHRVPFSYNEMSARYAPLPDENYEPSFDLLKERTFQALLTKNRQASSEVTTMPSDNVLRAWLQDLDKAYMYAELAYEAGLKVGIPKELARLSVPVGRYSKMRASANLRGWLNFLQLRMAEGAQWEIRQYANVVGNIVGELFPRTWSLFQGVKP